jgi:hypothetical protein
MSSLSDRCMRALVMPLSIIGSPRPCISFKASDIWLRKGAAARKTLFDKAGNRSGSVEARRQRDKSKREDKMNGTSRDAMQERSTRTCFQLLGVLELSPRPDQRGGSWRHSRTVMSILRPKDRCSCAKTRLRIQMTETEIYTPDHCVVQRQVGPCVEQLQTFRSKVFLRQQLVT